MPVVHLDIVSHVFLWASLEASTPTVVIFSNQALPNSERQSENGRVVSYGCIDKQCQFGGVVL